MEGIGIPCDYQTCVPRLRGPGTFGFAVIRRDIIYLVYMNRQCELVTGVETCVLTSIGVRNANIRICKETIFDCLEMKCPHSYFLFSTAVVCLNSRTKYPEIKQHIDRICVVKVSDYFITPHAMYRDFCTSGNDCGLFKGFNIVFWANPQRS